jgi:hypothetical protein
MDVKIKVKPTKSEADGMKNVYDILASGARSIERSFTEPDDDWEPVWVVITPDGQGTMLGSEMHKHTTAEIVGSYARKVGAHVVGYIWSKRARPCRRCPIAPRRSRSRSTRPARSSSTPLRSRASRTSRPSSVTSQDSTSPPTSAAPWSNRCRQVCAGWANRPPHTNQRRTP